MRVSFYEEFPESGLGKCELVSFKADLFVAAHGLAEFDAITKRLKRHSLITPCYWPVLSKEEGYWMSPFADRIAVRRIIDELTADRRTLRVAWDAEPPLRRSLMARIWRAPGTARLIDRFLRDTVHEVLFTESVFLSKFGLLGFSKNMAHHTCGKTIMLYSSFLGHGFLRERALRIVKDEHSLLGNRLSVGIGCIAKGIHGDERIISPSQLRADLEEMRRMGIAEVIIYRLGGLTKRYEELLARYAADG